MRSDRRIHAGTQTNGVSTSEIPETVPLAVRKHRQGCGTSCGRKKEMEKFSDLLEERTEYSFRGKHLRRYDYSMTLFDCCVHSASPHTQNVIGETSDKVCHQKRMADPVEDYGRCLRHWDVRSTG